MKTNMLKKHFLKPGLSIVHMARTFLDVFPPSPAHTSRPFSSIFRPRSSNRMTLKDS